MMKIKLIIVFFVFISQQINSQEKKEFYENGQLQSVTDYKNGKKEGKYVMFSKNGKISVVGYYKNNLETGIWKSYANGQIYWIRERSGDLTIGTEYQFNSDNGLPKSEIKYNSLGEKHGRAKYYNEQGKLIWEGNHKDNKLEGLWYGYHSNGQLATIRFWKENKLMDIINCYNNYGVELDCGNVINGNGYLKEYDENQNLKTENQYINGIKSKSADSFEGSWILTSNPNEANPNMTIEKKDNSYILKGDGRTTFGKKINNKLIIKAEGVTLTGELINNKLIFKNESNIVSQFKRLK